MTPPCWILPIRRATIALVALAWLLLMSDETMREILSRVVRWLCHGNGATWPP